MANLIFDKGVILKKKGLFFKAWLLQWSRIVILMPKGMFFNFYKVFKKQPENSKFDPMWAKNFAKLGHPFLTILLKMRLNDVKVSSCQEPSFIHHKS